MSELQTVINNMRGVLAYRNKDIKSLDMSRSASAGRINDPEFAEYAGVNNDPWISIDMVKTFVRTYKNKLSGSPFRPRDDRMYAMGKVIKLDGKIEDAVETTMNDGFAFYGVAFKDGIPVVQEFDARYVLYDGEERTLRDCKNFLCFRIEHKSFEEIESGDFANYPAEYVKYDPTCEKVISYHYHKVANEEDEGEHWVLDTYENYDAEPIRQVLPNIDRVPVVRFTGEKVELSDQRYHYRGLYWTMGSIQKALCASATKLQTRVVTEDDANYIATTQSMAGNAPSWDGVGVRQWNYVNNMGQNNDKGPTPITHDNQTLLASVNVWKETMQMMLNPIAVSKSDAVSEEEVRARNEVRDSICNSFLRPACEAVAEIYRLINAMYQGNNAEVEIVNGFLENAKRTKEKGELNFIYEKAKESGLNTQGIVQLMLSKSDLDATDKEAVAATFKQDPMASPKVVQLNTQIQQLNQTIQKLNLENTMLKNRVADRIERNDNYIEQQERKYRSDLAFKYWQEEQKQTTNALMEVLKQAVQAGNNDIALQIVDRISQQSVNPLVQQDQIIDAYAQQNKTTAEDLAMRGNPNALSQQTMMGGANNPNAQRQAQVQQTIAPQSVQQQGVNPAMQNAVQQQMQAQAKQQLAQRLAQQQRGNV